MKKSVIALTLALTCGSLAASADIKDILNGLGKKGDKEATTETTATSPKESKGSDILSGLKSIGSKLGLLPEEQVTVDYLVGSWNYKKPAVSFKSDNFLAKAGGLAGAAKVESELKPYYEKFGFDKMVLTVEPDSTFTMKLAHGTLSGEITTNTTDKTLEFHFKVFGVKFGSMEAYVNASSEREMDITFDVSRLLALFQRIAAFTGNKSMQALSSLLDNYDGMTAGFSMQKSK